MARSPEERDRDRADLLAALDDYGTSMPTQNLIAAAYGMLRTQVIPGLQPYQRAYADLRAMEREGVLIREAGYGQPVARWQRATADLDEIEDEREVERMMRSWDPVGA